MEKILKNNWIKWSIVAVGVASVISLIICSFLTPIYVDSATILIEMERIYDGYVPYKTMNLNYPPLWFYINVALKWIFCIPYACYDFYLVIHWIYLLGCAICLYCISRQFLDQKYIALGLAWMYLVVSYWLQGNIVLFEIPSIFWGLIAILLTLKWENRHPIVFVFIGILTCFAFLTKQFGAGFLLLVSWLIVTSKHVLKWRQLTFYIVGYILPLLICFACWGFDIFRCIIFNGYGTNEMDAYNGITTLTTDKLQRMFEQLLYFVNRVGPIVYGGIVMLPLAIKYGRYREILLCLFALGGFSLQFWFVHGGSHYYQYLIPFALLLIPICLSLNTKYVKYIVYVLVILTTLFSCYSTFKNRVWKMLANHDYNQKLEQFVFGKEISGMIDKGKTVYIVHGGLDYIYYTANLYPPCMQKYGYAVGPMEINVASSTEMVNNADYIIHYSNKMLKRLYPDGRTFEYYFTDSIQDVIAQYPSDTLDENASIVIHYMYLPKNSER